MSIGVASVQQQKFITASAVYYREQRFAAESAVVEVGQVSSILVQCLASTSLEQYWKFWNSIWYQEFWNSIG